METNEKSRMSADEKNWQANMEIQAWQFFCQVARTLILCSPHTLLWQNYHIRGKTAHVCQKPVA